MDTVAGGRRARRRISAVVHRRQHELPRRQPVLAHPVGRDEALVRAATDAVGQPLGELVLLRRGPAAVDLEPLVGPSDGVSCGHGRTGSTRPPTPRTAPPPPAVRPSPRSAAPPAPPPAGCR